MKPAHRLVARSFPSCRTWQNRTQVDHDVEDRPIGAADQLRLAVTAANVQAADDASGGARHAVLGKSRRIDPGRPRDVRIESPGEKATLVYVRLRPEQQGAGNARNCGYLHYISLSVSGGLHHYNAALSG